VTSRFRYVFLEAGWMGKPVIAAGRGVRTRWWTGRPDARGRGFRSDIVRAVSDLLDDPVRARSMGSNGRAHAASMAVGKVFENYLEIMSEKHCTFVTSMAEILPTLKIFSGSS